jgi:serine/threonine-protein kinase HipA
MNKCLYCYNALDLNQVDYHPACSKKFFGTATPPEIGLDNNRIKELAVKALSSRITVTGVQPKLSLDFGKSVQKEKRLTLVGLWGRFILKPPFDDYPEMVEIEDLTMHMAEVLKIKTAAHTLARLQSGELAYITKRFDRTKKEKIPVEDMAQLTETLTENKYRGSMELIARTIKKYSDYPGIDLIRLFEITLFSFLTGNSDMHLKNFSLLTDEDNEVLLSPAYDLLATKLLVPSDKEDLALTLNGRNNNIRRKDFNIFAEYLEIEKKTIDKIYKRFYNALPLLEEWINKSFLSPEMKEKYIEMLNSRKTIIWGDT